MRWLESVEKRLKYMGMRNWRRQTLDREQWRTPLEEAEVYQKLYCQKKKKKKKKK
jgi:hypothetical protein